MDRESLDRDWDDTTQRRDSDAEPKSSTSPVVWSVNVGDQDVVDMTHADLVERVRSGRLPVTTFLWRDGMDDWKALDRFPEFAKLVQEAKKSDSGLRAKPDEPVAPSSDTVSSDATPPHISPRPPLATLPGLDGRITRRDRPERKPTAAPASEATTERDETSDALKDLGVLAVYERPAATLEFEPLATEPASERGTDEVAPPSDALTPTNPTPLRRRSLARSVPPQAAISAKKGPSAPPPPPLRKSDTKRATALATAPVTAKVETPKAASASTSAGSDSVAKASAPAHSNPHSAEPEALRAEEVSAARPPLTPVSSSAQDVPPPPASIVGPPRPALETLPPIIVRELPIAPGDMIETPAPVRHDESTLVLSRRKTHRWVPLRAAIVSAFGSACLASVLTWLVVRPTRAARAPEPAQASELAQKTAGEARASVTTDPAVAAAAPVANAEQAPAAGEVPAEKAPENAADTPPGTREAKSEEAARAKKSADSRRAESTHASNAEKGEAWRKDDPDPGLGEAASSDAKPAASVATARPTTPATRAGWPSNPGF